MTTQRRQILGWGAGLLTAGAAVANWPTYAAPSTGHDKLIWRERALIGFGTTLWLRAAHVNADRLELALTDAVKAIRGVEADMSLFNPDSAVSRLNRDGILHQPSAQLLSVLTLARHVSSRSQGAFDVTVQPLWNIWSQAQAAEALPDRTQLQRQLKLVNWRALEVHHDIVRLNAKGMGVSLNGIAQGYAADLVRAVLQSHGVMNALIDTGETASLGKAPGDQPWRFGVESAAKPNAQQPVMTADGRAMATSSDAHTVFTPDHLHHHIFNPLTGDSPRYWSTATVIAPSCALADALTKVFFMCSPALVKSTAQAWGVDVIMQDKNGKWLNTLSSVQS
jgi:thiamine biosynthesis lipoprotein